MMEVDDRPTIGERYAVATETSDLRIKSGRRGQADLILAAGMCDATLGGQLFRLCAEHDHVAAAVRGTAGNYATERALILMGLKSLRSTKDALGSAAIQLATRICFMRPDAEVLKITGRVLDVFLSPNCPHCDGRGSTGGGRLEHSGVKVLCRPCAGTGRRHKDIGRDDEERRFAAAIMADMERKASEFDYQMRAMARD